MPEKIWLLCMPVPFKGYVPPGSLPDKCSECGQPVVVSPSSLLIMHDNPSMNILCIPCGVTELKKDKKFKIKAPTPAQAEEIKEYLDSR